MNKNILKSRTFWVQVLGIVALAIPASSGFISENLGASGAAWAFINIVLRLVTKEKVQIL